jgi:hypothetical protein
MFDYIDSMFIDEKEQKLNEVRARLIANGVLKPKQIKKKNKKKKKK